MEKQNFKAACMVYVAVDSWDTRFVSNILRSKPAYVVSDNGGPIQKVHFYIFRFKL